MLGNAVPREYTSSPHFVLLPMCEIVRKDNTITQAAQVMYYICFMTESVLELFLHFQFLFIMTNLMCKNQGPETTSIKSVLKDQQLVLCNLTDTEWTDEPCYHLDLEYCPEVHVLMA
jgi:hypothetical protein